MKKQIIKCICLSVFGFSDMAKTKLDNLDDIRWQEGYHASLQDLMFPYSQ